MSALIFRASLAYSCRMSAASAHTRRNVMRSRRADTKASVSIAASTGGSLRQIDRADNLLLAGHLNQSPGHRATHPVCSAAETRLQAEAPRRPVSARISRSSPVAGPAEAAPNRSLPARERERVLPEAVEKRVIRGERGAVVHRP